MPEVRYYRCESTKLDGQRYGVYDAKLELVTPCSNVGFMNMTFNYLTGGIDRLQFSWVSAEDFGLGGLAQGLLAYVEDDGLGPVGKHAFMVSE